MTTINGEALVRPEIVPRAVQLVRMRFLDRTAIRTHTQTDKAQFTELGRAERDVWLLLLLLLLHSSCPR